MAIPPLGPDGMRVDREDDLGGPRTLKFNYKGHEITITCTPSNGFAFNANGDINDNIRKLAQKVLDGLPKPAANTPAVTAIDLVVDVEQGGEVDRGPILLSATVHRGQNREDFLRERFTNIPEINEIFKRLFHRFHSH